MSKIDFKYCYGCGVCAVACHRNAIQMAVNEDGFLHPLVNPSCVDCGICLKICAFNDNTPTEANDSIIPIAKAAWSKDKNIRNKCTSGGVSFEIGRYLISNGYTVIGCRYNSDTRDAEHYLSTNEQELESTIGSKYIQSSTYHAFSQIKKGNKYLIIGTPCQIDSLRRLLKMRQMENDVILLDFFCHGVPSKLMWNQYLKELQDKIGDFDIVHWRDKKAGWHDSWVMNVDGKYFSWFSKGDLFYKMFLKDRCLGDACYVDCKYKYDKSSADIRIGDLWGSAYENDDDGVNGVICFTSKGRDLLNKMTSVLHIEDSELEIVGEAQMKACAKKPISNAYVMNQLKKGKSLKEINKISNYIELIERIPKKIIYYTKRVPEKIKEKTNRWQI